MSTQAEMLDAAEKLIAKGLKAEAKELLELAQQMQPTPPLTAQAAPFPSFAPTGEMQRRIEQAAEANVWPAKPSGLCRFCPCSKLCPHG